MASHSVKNAPDLAWAVGGDDGHLTHFHLKSLCHLLLSDVEKRGISGEIAAKTGLYEYFFMFWIRPFHVLNKYFCFLYLLTTSTMTVLVHLSTHSSSHS